MKTLLALLLWLIIGSFGSLSAQNTIYLTAQPTDMGLGVRYDRQIGDLGLYGSLAKGHYKLEDGSYIDDHYKVSLGGLAYIPEHFGFVSFGISYHHYGSYYFYEPRSGNVMTPISCEGGVGTWFGKVSVAFRMDIIKWESMVELGIKF